MRWAVAAVALAWLAVTGRMYAQFCLSQPVGFRHCVEHPEACRDRDVLLPLWQVVAVNPDGYALYKGWGPVPVVYGEGPPAQAPRVGDTVSVVGRFDEARVVVVEVERQVHRLRKLKEVLGFVGLGLAGVVGLVGYRVTRQGLAARRNALGLP